MHYVLKKQVGDGFVVVDRFADATAITDKIGKAKIEDPQGGFIVEKISTALPKEDVAVIAPKRRRKGVN